MATNTNGVRPKYLPLGVDGEGASHVFRTTDDTIHVINGAERERVEDVANTPLNRWMDFVDSQRGWDDPQYGLDFAEMLAQTVGGVQGR